MVLAKKTFLLRRKKQNIKKSQALIYLIFVMLDQEALRNILLLFITQMNGNMLLFVVAGISCCYTFFLSFFFCFVFYPLSLFKMCENILNLRKWKVRNLTALCTIHNYYLHLYELQSQNLLRFNCQSVKVITSSL